MEDWLTEQAPGGQKKSKVPGYFHPCKLFSTPLNKEQGSKEQLLQPVFLGKHLKKNPIFEAALTHALVLLRAVCPRSHSPVDIT